ncbi:MAG: dockerin type I repeat-containing protein [Porcipelethomonas sp.]
MKKTFRKILSGLSVFAVMTACAFPAVSAEQTYDLENQDYINYIDEYCGERPSNEELLTEVLLGWNVNGDSSVIKHLYKYKNSESFDPSFAEFRAEWGTENMRFFSPLRIYMDKLSNVNTPDFCSEYSADEINGFLEAEGLKAQVEEMFVSDKEIAGVRDYVRLSYDEDITCEEAIEVVYALNREYNIYPEGYDYLLPTMPFYGTQESTAVVSDGEGDPVIAASALPGDADLDGRLGISDLTKVAKFNASPDIYPISDPAALANADVNQDGKIDSLDTGRLVEIILGTYESAVE